MRKGLLVISVLLVAALWFSTGYAAYEHEGEKDSGEFLAVYPAATGTKIDHCATCHTGGTVESGGKTTTMGSCQWCHNTYGYDGSGNIVDTLNGYGKDYLLNGRNQAAVQAIAGFDSDSDGYTNVVEIAALRYPGNASDDPSKIPAPSMVVTKAQLEAMPQHAQFLLMNTSRSGDFYAQYTGPTMEHLLNYAGILPAATDVNVFAPDGFSNNHPMQPSDVASLYHVVGTYPGAVFYYDAQADDATNPASGWCDYSAPSAQGRKHLDPIVNPDGNKLILAVKRESTDMDPGVLTSDNKLDGEGPFRVVPPQKVVGPPDQSVKSDVQDVVWPYDNAADHNAGFSIRSVSLIEVAPLPEGTTAVDIYEAGWEYVDEGKVLIYGNIAWQPGAGSSWWYTPGEEGTGVSMEKQNNVLFLTWYTYEDGKPVWLTAGGKMQSSTVFTGDLYRWTGWSLDGNPGAFSQTTAGQITLAFSGDNAASMDWTFGDLNGTKSMAKFLESRNPGGTKDPRNINGWWQDPAYNGMGVYLEALGGEIFIAWYHYNDAGIPRWWSTGGAFTPGQTSFTATLQEWANGQCIGCQNSNPGFQNKEEIGLTFQTNVTATMTWKGKTFNLQRFQFGQM